MGAKHKESKTNNKNTTLERPVVENIVGVFLGYNQYWSVGFVVVCPGAPDGSTGSGSGFKASQNTGHVLK